MTIATAFLFNGPLDGEVMELAERAIKLEVVEFALGDTLVYVIYSVNKIAGIECRIYKYKESYKNDQRRSN